MVMRGELGLADYITHTFDGLDGVNKAIDALHSGDCLRAVIRIAKSELPVVKLPK